VSTQEPTQHESEALRRIVGMVLAERLPDDNPDDVTFDAIRDEVVALALAAGFRRVEVTDAMVEAGARGGWQHQADELERIRPGFFSQVAWADAEEVNRIAWLSLARAILSAALGEETPT